MRNIITNLALAYGLMSKDQFIDSISKIAEKNQWNEEKLQGLLEAAFVELERLQERRWAKQAMEETLKTMAHEKSNAESSDISGLKSSIDNLVDELRKMNQK